VYRRAIVDLALCFLRQVLLIVRMPRSAEFRQQPFATGVLADAETPRLSNGNRAARYATAPR